MGWGQKRLSYLAHMFPAEVEQGVPCLLCQLLKTSVLLLYSASFSTFLLEILLSVSSRLGSGKWAVVFGKVFFPLSLEGMKVKSKTIALSFQIVLNN